MAYLEFIEKEQINLKTKVYDVFGTNPENSLAKIKFYPQWRTYSFQPYSGTIFDIKCLTEIILFIEKLNSEWRNNLKTK